MSLEHSILGIPRPDLIIYLRVPIAVTAELLAKKRAAKENAPGDAQDAVKPDQA